MDKEITKILEVIPKDVMVDYIKAVRSSSYKTGFFDGCLTGGTFVASLLLTLTAAGVATYGGYKIYNYISSISEGGKKDDRNKQLPEQQ